MLIYFTMWANNIILKYTYFIITSIEAYQTCTYHITQNIFRLGLYEDDTWIKQHQKCHDDYIFNFIWFQMHLPFGWKISFASHPHMRVCKSFTQTKSATLPQWVIFELRITRFSIITNRNPELKCASLENWNAISRT